MQTVLIDTDIAIDYLRGCVLCKGYRKFCQCLKYRACHD